MAYFLGQPVIMRQLKLHQYRECSS